MAIDTNCQPSPIPIFLPKKPVLRQKESDIMLQIMK